MLVCYRYQLNKENESLTNALTKKTYGPTLDSRKYRAKLSLRTHNSVSTNPDECKDVE